jgi:hypothetical protein
MRARRKNEIGSKEWGDKYRAHSRGIRSRSGEMNGTCSTSKAETCDDVCVGTRCRCRSGRRRGAVRACSVDQYSSNEAVWQRWYSKRRDANSAFRSSYVVVAGAVSDCSDCVGSRSDIDSRAVDKLSDGPFVRLLPEMPELDLLTVSPPATARYTPGTSPDKADIVWAVLRAMMASRADISNTGHHQHTPLRSKRRMYDQSMERHRRSQR